MPEYRFAICVQNEGYPVSLELWKVYRIIPDKTAAEHHLVRVVDESGEDYLYDEHEPGPRGSPHEPHGPTGEFSRPAFVEMLALAVTAKTESCFSKRRLRQLGHAALLLPLTINSNRWRHSRQTYSKIGMIRSIPILFRATQTTPA